MSIFAERNDKKVVEEGDLLAPKFDSNGLIPAVAVDHQTGEVLMQAFMNEEALQKTIEYGEVVYYSRSRQEIWHKGATSGLVQKVHEILTDCDQDCIVVRVEAIGGASCHVGYRSCFYRSIPFGEAAKGDGPLKLSFTQSEKAFDPEKVYGKK